MPLGTVQIVLHSHLPYVISHGRWPHGLDWLNEANAETYLPLLKLFRRLVEEGISPKVTLGITPVLAEQLTEPRFMEEFRGYLRQKVEAAQADVVEFKRHGFTQRMKTAELWASHFGELAEVFDAIDGNVIAEFADLQRAGHLEITTCAATHGYLPLLGTDNSVMGQIMTGVENYRRHFGCDPRGIWLPECAYRPRYEWAPPIGEIGEIKPVLRRGIEEFLYEAGIRYFFADSHLIKGGQAMGVYIERFEALQRLWGQFQGQYTPRAEIVERSTYLVYLANSSGTERSAAVFSRDTRTGLQVWSGEHGYPGTFAYLDFHKKHFPGGHRYWRVTDAKADLGSKEEYDPALIEDLLTSQAHHFASLCHEIAKRESKAWDKPVVITSPYDTELFGHWWFEGPRWLEHVIRAINAADGISTGVPSEQLAERPPEGLVSLPEGSWGEGGFHYIWLNEFNKWTWKKVYAAEDRYRALVNEHLDSVTEDQLRLLKQMARELLLLESSDWQFLISTQSAADYAGNRVSWHYDAFTHLGDFFDRLIANEELTPENWQYIADIEEQDPLFPGIDPSWWRDKALFPL